jgi:hypothetical protein
VVKMCCMNKAKTQTRFRGSNHLRVIPYESEAMWQHVNLPQWGGGARVPPQTQGSKSSVVGEANS